MIPQELKFNVKMDAEEFMKKHIYLQKIDREGSLKKNIENIFRIMYTPDYDELIKGRR